MIVVVAPAGHAAAAAPQPITAAFYYAWYPETFQPTPHAMPALGRYQSTDLGLIRTHLDVLRRAGVQAAIVSWWGITDRSDARFQRLEQVTEQLHSPERLAIYDEPEGQGDPSVDRLSADITHVLALARSPAYLRVDGRPVIFAFSESGDGCSMVTRWNAANRGRAHIVPKVFPGYRSCSDQPTFLARIRAGAGTGAGARPVLLGEPGLLPRPGVAATARAQRGTVPRLRPRDVCGAGALATHHDLQRMG